MGSNIYLHSVGLHRVANRAGKILGSNLWLYYILLPRSYNSFGYHYKTDLSVSYTAFNQRSSETHRLWEGDGF